MHRPVAKSKKCASRMRAAEPFHTRVVVSGNWIVQFAMRTCDMGQCPVRTPHLAAGWVADADPSRGQTKLVPLAEGKRLARPIGNMLHGNLAVAKKYSV